MQNDLSKRSQVGSACTPAMAAGLTDHVWSICELLGYQIAPPHWVPPSALFLKCGRVKGGKGEEEEERNATDSPSESCTR
jgi:hypothetical protein